jgi:hypothetical protein
VRISSDRGYLSAFEIVDIDECVGAGAENEIGGIDSELDIACVKASKQSTKDPQ